MTLCWPFLWLVCVWAGQRISLSVLAQKPTLRARSSARPEVDEGKKVPEKIERASLQRKAEENSRFEIAVQRRTQSAEGGSEKMEAGQSRDESVFLMIWWKFRAKYTPSIACKCTESCTKVSHWLPPSCTWSWPKSVFVRLFFFLHPLSCVLRISKEMCNAPGRKPLDESLALSSLV